MARLDLNYVADLALHARQGDSNAFAELFAATHQKLYAFALDYLQDELLAQAALQSCYVYALKNISALRQPTLVVAWLNQIAMRSCFRMQHRGALPGEDIESPENRSLALGARRYTVRQVLTLPFSEAQAILLRHLCGFRLREVACLLEMRRGEARAAIGSGLKRLRRLSAPEEGGAT